VAEVLGPLRHERDHRWHLGLSAGPHGAPARATNAQRFADARLRHPGATLGEGPL